MTSPLRSPNIPGSTHRAQLADYIESRALKWIKDLEQTADLTLHPPTDLPPGYDLAAKILLGLLKLSSLNRQRIDISAQVAMTTGPDLSSLYNEQLDELALRIGRVKSAKPS
jgi:hypothetical protein